MKYKRTQKDIDKDFLCLDCSKDTHAEYYMIHNQLWEKANPKCSGMLCIDCLEKRLGRKLQSNDFSNVPINGQNWISRQGVELAHRATLQMWSRWFGDSEENIKNILEPAGEICGSQVWKRIND